MHLTDDQLNEYLDNETTERAQIEAHLTVCADCAARLSALEVLFAELDALPELELSKPIAARFMSQPNLTPQLPRWLTLTATLQAAFALIVLLIAAPLVAEVLPPIALPSLTDLLLQIQALWLAMPSLLSSFHFPALPQLAMPDLPNLALASTLAGVSLLWLVGNGLLLRKQIR